MTRPFSVAVLTVSDRCSKGLAVDTSGPALAQLARDHLQALIAATACVPDEPDQIADHIKRWAASTNPPIDLILTTGGTGLSPRDRTPEATLPLLDRHYPSLMQLIHLRSYEKTPLTFLSRGVAGTIAHSLIINLPGSQRGSTESFQATLDILPHALKVMRQDITDHAPPSL